MFLLGAPWGVLTTSRGSYPPPMGYLEYPPKLGGMGGSIFSEVVTNELQSTLR